jgi:hypothetical protein
MDRLIGSSPVATTNYYRSITDLHNLQSLHTNLLCPNLYSTNFHNSLTAPHCTALVPIRSSTAKRLLISLYYRINKVFTGSRLLQLLTSGVRWLSSPIQSPVSYMQTHSLSIVCLATSGLALYNRGTDQRTENTVLLLRHIPRHPYLGSQLARWLLPSNEL